MKKSELIAEVAQETGLPKVAITDVINSLIGVTAKHLRAEGEALLPGLGKLSTTTRSARQGRNPKTGEAVHIPASVSVKFKAASDLKSAVQ